MYRGSLLKSDREIKDYDYSFILLRHTHKYFSRSTTSFESLPEIDFQLKAIKFSPYKFKIMFRLLSLTIDDSNATLYKQKTISFG